MIIYNASITRGDGSSATIGSRTVQYTAVLPLEVNFNASAWDLRARASAAALTASDNLLD